MEELKKVEAKVHEGVEESKKIPADTAKNGKKILLDVRKVKKEVTAAVTKHKKDMEDIRLKFESFEQRVAEFNRNCNDVNSSMERIEVKESFLCSYVDITK